MKAEPEAGKRPRPLGYPDAAHTVPQASVPELELASWEAWQARLGTPALSIGHFHERSSPRNRPRVEAHLAYDPDAIYAIFRVQTERHVRARYREHQSPVCQDSCVELFLQPGAGAGGYINIEANCLGTLLSHWIVDPNPPLREGRLFSQSTPLDARQLEQIHVVSSLEPDDLTPDRDGQPRDWTLGLRLPLNVLRCHTRLASTLCGARMTANLYKCADASPEPHWAAWSDVGPKLNFHQPRRFGLLEFQ